ncbi:hypothetical protein IDH31_00330, partial [Pelagibacterales bacterium SAG-MED32]|nr:hypothetical protein [Pelagibacterales bacterium SAG-MED32]
MSNKILIPFPNKIISKTFKNEKEIYFFNGLYFYSADKISFSRKLPPYIKNKIKLTKKIERVELIEKLDFNYPIFKRWGHLDSNLKIDYDLYIYKINEISRILKETGIEKVIFFTSVPHHIDTVVFNIACEKALIEKFFLYHNPILNTVLVRKETTNYEDSKYLRFENPFIYQTEHLLDKVVQNKILGKQKEGDQNNSPTKWWKMNIYTSLLFHFVSRIKKFINLKFEKDYNYYSIYKMIKNQKEYLRLYESNMLSEKSFFTQTSKEQPELLIAAHFQPEATTFPEGCEYSNHISIVKKIRQLGYKRKIYYKEHFASKRYSDSIIGLTRVGLERDKFYYETLKDLGCVFLDYNFNLSLEKKFNEIILPVTITGSIAFERSLMGYKTIISGKPWY